MRLGGRTRIATVAVAGVVAIAAGCGGGGGGGGGTLSKSDYAKKLGSIGNDVKSLRTISTSGGSAAAKVEHLRAGLTSAADRLSKLNPPSNVKADNTELATGLRELASALGSLEKAVKDNNAAEIQSAATKFQTSPGLQKFQHAITDLKAKGYNGP